MYVRTNSLIGKTLNSPSRPIIMYSLIRSKLPSQTITLLTASNKYCRVSKQRYTPLTVVAAMPTNRLFYSYEYKPPSLFRVFYGVVATI